MNIEINVISFSARQVTIREVPHEMVIDCNKVVLACPIAASLRTSRLAPITARTAIMFRDDENELKLVYAQQDLINNGQWRTSSTGVGSLLRICAISEKLSFEELTPEALSADGFILMKDLCGLSQTVCVRNFP